MEALTLQQAQNQLTAWIAAETAIASGAQEYSIGGRALKRADLAHVAERIQFYSQLVARLSRNGGARVRRVIPLDQ